MKAITNFTCNNKCSNCGNCCIPWLPITKTEYENIKRYIKKHNIQPIPLQDGNNFYLDCCFHNRLEHKCNIYPVRPAVCRAFRCDLPEEKIQKNKEHFNQRAYYNKIVPGTIRNLKPMDLLFYKDYACLLMLILRDVKPKNMEDLIDFLNKTNNKELIELIKKGIVKLEWSDD